MHCPNNYKEFYFPLAILSLINPEVYFNALLVYSLKMILRISDSIYAVSVNMKPSCENRPHAVM